MGERESELGADFGSLGVAKHCVSDGKKRVRGLKLFAGHVRSQLWAAVLVYSWPLIYIHIACVTFARHIGIAHLASEMLSYTFPTFPACLPRADRRCRKISVFMVTPYHSLAGQWKGRVCCPVPDATQEGSNSVQDVVKKRLLSICKRYVVGSRPSDQVLLSPHAMPSRTKRCSMVVAFMVFSAYTIV